MATLYNLTPASAAQALQNDGLAAMGLATVLLGTRWSNQTPPATGFTAGALTLALAPPLRAPFRGILEFTSGPIPYFDPAGAPLSGQNAVLRLHPQAAQRLQRLVAVRYLLANTPQPQPQPHPVPWA